MNCGSRMNPDGSGLARKGGSGRLNRVNPADRGAMSKAVDELVLELRQLKATHGDPSFSELAKKVATVRLNRGLDLAAAKASTSTLNDAFKMGRTRLNPALISDIVIALTDDVGEGERWAQRCGLANSGLIEGEKITPASDVVVPVVIDSPQLVGRQETNSLYDFTEEHRSIFLALLVLLGVSVDFIVPLFLDKILGGLFPLFGDMIGTAIVAIVAGPWTGIITGVLSTGASSLIAGVTNLPFMLVKISGALFWGCGVRKYGYGSSYGKFIGLNLLVALISTSIASLILLTAFQGDLQHGAANLLANEFIYQGHSVTQAVFLVNFAISILDKLITGVLALLVCITALRWWAPKNLVGIG